LRRYRRRSAGLCAAAVSELVTPCDRLSRRDLPAVASPLAPSTARLARTIQGRALHNRRIGGAPPWHEGSLDASLVASHGGYSRLPPWTGLGSGWQPAFDRSQLCSLDEYMKSFLKRASAGWVAVVLEKAGVLTMDRSRPARGQVLFRLVDRAPLRETQVVGRPQSRTARGMTAWSVRWKAG
jgi:hypothetical protein